MARLIWDSNYEVGVDRGVYYPKNAPGESWNGLVAVTETPESEERSRYLEGMKIQSYRQIEEFSGSIEAFTYPESLEDTFAKHQRRRSFGMSYRVMTKDSYKIHLIYNVMLSPSDASYVQEDPGTFKWDFTTSPMPVPDAKPSAHLVVEVDTAYTWVIDALENMLYGSDTTGAYLPSPAEVYKLFDDNAILRVVDNGDGSFTVTGPAEAITMLDATTFEITWPSAVYISSSEYTLSSH
jgi:hypothetical protein